MEEYIQGENIFFEYVCFKKMQLNFDQIFILEGVLFHEVL